MNLRVVYFPVKHSCLYMAFPYIRPAGKRFNTGSLHVSICLEAVL